MANRLSPNEVAEVRQIIKANPDMTLESLASLLLMSEDELVANIVQYIPESVRKFALAEEQEETLTPWEAQEVRKLMLATPAYTLEYMTTFLMMSEGAFLVSLQEEEPQENEVSSVVFPSFETLRNYKDDVEAWFANACDTSGRPSVEQLNEMALQIAIRHGMPSTSTTQWASWLKKYIEGLPRWAAEQVVRGEGA